MEKLNFPEISRNEILMGLLAFLLSLGVGIAAGNVINQQESTFRQSYDIKVNSDNSIKSVDFENHSIQILMEDRKAARIYLDYNKDGSADRELNLSASNSTQLIEKYVTLERKSYLFRFEYFDDPDRRGDAFLKLRTVERVQ